MSSIPPTDRTGIDIQHTSKIFARRNADGRTSTLRVLDDVSFHIADHEFVAVIGPSGCGKTTLLRIVAGLERADDGSITVDTQPIKGPGDERAMVFQQASLLPWTNVLNNIAFGLKVRGINKTERYQRARALLALVGLEGFEHALPRELSGGMQQRVGLARALAVDPRYLLMDEPFGSLDEITRRGMQTELMQIWAKQRKGAMFVTHSVDEAVILSDRVVVLSARPGRVVADIRIDLPRPRSHAQESSPEYVQAREKVWSTIDAWVSERVVAIEGKA